MWHIVKNKKKIKSNNIKKNYIQPIIIQHDKYNSSSFVDKTFNEIKDIIIITLQKYNPSYIYIYGSRSRNTHKIYSDVDIMVFWKYPIPTIEKLMNYKQELITNLNLNVDFVCMQKTNKYIYIDNEKLKCYYENVIIDAKCIYPENNDKTIQELIDTSIKLEKIE